MEDSLRSFLSWYGRRSKFWRLNDGIERYPEKFRILAESTFPFSCFANDKSIAIMKIRNPDSGTRSHGIIWHVTIWQHFWNTLISRKNAHVLVTTFSTPLDLTFFSTFLVYEFSETSKFDNIWFHEKMLVQAFKMKFSPIANWNPWNRVYSDLSN